LFEAWLIVKAEAVLSAISISVAWLETLMSSDYKDTQQIKLSRLNRRKLLRFFHDYFQICQNNEFKLKSFDILLQIFDD